MLNPFFREVARRFRAVTNEPQSLQFLIQRVAGAIQHGNAACSNFGIDCGWELVLYCYY